MTNAVSKVISHPELVSGSGANTFYVIGKRFGNSQQYCRSGSWMLIERLILEEAIIVYIIKNKR